MLREITNLCRACLTREKQLLSTSQSQTALYKLNFIINISNETSNDRPNKVCGDCLKEINRTYSFIMTCKNSYESIRKLSAIAKDPTNAMEIEDGTKYHIFELPQIQQSSTESTFDVLTIKQEDNEDSCCSLNVNDQDYSLSDEEKNKIKHDADKLDVLDNDNEINFGELFKSEIIEEASQNSIADNIGLSPSLKEEESTSDLIDIKPETSIGNYSPNVIFERNVEEIKIKSELDEVNTETNGLEVVAYMDPSTEEHPVQTFQCPFCKWKFYKHLDFNEHVKNCATDADVEEFEEVSIDFSSPDQQSKSSFKCLECEANFKNQSSLKYHIKHHSLEVMFTYSKKCIKCNITFKNASHLKKHRLTMHIGERPIVCDICCKTFITFRDLNQHHKLKHEGDNPFVCELCKEKFQLGDLLRKHMDEHSKNAPFKCGLCLEWFLYKTCFLYHQKKHKIKAKPSKPSRKKCCRKCGAGFYSLTKLNKHVLLKNCSKSKRRIFSNKTSKSKPTV